MNTRRRNLVIVTGVLALSLLLCAGAALAQDTPPNPGAPERPAAPTHTTNRNWLQRMQEWMRPEAWGQMIQRMTQVHGAEFTGQTLQRMNEGGGCHSNGEGAAGMMGGLNHGMWGGMSHGVGGTMGGAGR